MGFKHVGQSEHPAGVVITKLGEAVVPFVTSETTSHTQMCVCVFQCTLKKGRPSKISKGWISATHTYVLFSEKKKVKVKQTTFNAETEKFLALNITPVSPSLTVTSTSASSHRKPTFSSVAPAPINERWRRAANSGLPWFQHKPSRGRGLGGAGGGGGGCRHAAAFHEPIGSRAYVRSVTPGK